MDTNNYTTAMTGIKFKLAHKHFDKEKWSASDRAQRKRLIGLLQEMIAQLQEELDDSEGREDKKEVSADNEDK